MSYRHAFCALLIFVLLSPVSLWAAKIVFASPEDLPPKVYTEKGELKGIYIDVIREVCKRMKVESEFQFYPWARAMVLVKNGKVDAIFPPFKTRERTEFLYFPESVSITRNVVFAPKKRHLVVKNLADLRSLMLGINDQYSYGDRFDAYKPQLQLDLSLNEEMLVQKLAHGGPRRIDVAAASEEAFKFVAKRLNLRDEFEEIYTISENPSYVAFTKAKGPEGQKLSEHFGRTLRQLKNEGVVHKIIAKYVK